MSGILKCLIDGINNRGFAHKMNSSFEIERIMSGRRTLFLLCLYLLFINVLCDDGTFFLKVAKNVPRIGKRNKSNSNNNDDSFEKFFLKASKSVPRIGRRGNTEVIFINFASITYFQR